MGEDWPSCRVVCLMAPAAAQCDPLLAVILWLNFISAAPRTSACSCVCSIVGIDSVSQYEEAAGHRRMDGYITVNNNTSPVKTLQTHNSNYHWKQTERTEGDHTHSSSLPLCVISAGHRMETNTPRRLSTCDEVAPTLVPFKWCSECVGQSSDLVLSTDLTVWLSRRGRLHSALSETEGQCVCRYWNYSAFCLVVFLFFVFCFTPHLQLFFQTLLWCNYSDLRTSFWRFWSTVLRRFTEKAFPVDPSQ